jgi:hypothetical protein
MKTKLSILTIRTLVLGVLTFFSINSFATPTTYTVNFSITSQTITCHVGDILMFYGNATSTQFYVTVTGQPSIANTTSPTSLLIGSDTIAASTSAFQMLNTVSHQTSSGVIQVLSSAGIEQFANNNGVNIYPNPSNGSFVIEPNNNAKQTMRLYEVNGKTVLSQTISDKTHIDASSLNEGIYYISLSSSDGVKSKRIIIVK